MSPTTPTIVNHGRVPSSRPQRMRFPIGESLGQKRFAMPWVIMQTGGDRFHVADDADNREPRASSIKSSPADAFPDRRIVRPKTFRNALGDNADGRRGSGVARVEIAALQDRVGWPTLGKYPGTGTREYAV